MIVVIRSLIIALALGVAWVYAGRQLALFLDRFITIGVTSLPVSPLEYDGGSLLIGKLQMTFGKTDNLNYDLCVQFDSRNRVLLSTGGRFFTMGPRTNPVDPSGRPEIDLISEPGDKLSFTAVRSALGWPTPLEFNIMISHSPWWKRYVYYRLVWNKPSGAKLEMLWRYEQDYYTATGWTEPLMMWNSQTGLLRVDIRPETSRALTMPPPVTRAD
ncbi:MAG TPA: hypothetical protein VFE56_11830 [Candidatus Binataceae bacterium]|nr:hypothetical protein [Candidatus Binataceae bacterium]